MVRMTAADESTLIQSNECWAFNRLGAYSKPNSMITTRSESVLASGRSPLTLQFA
jgi:hypothetical protein